MIVGSQHFTTFDGRQLDFVGPCTYLLARDFVRDTFAIFIKYDLQSDRVTHKIIILIGRDAIELDIFNDVSKHFQISTFISSNRLSRVLKRKGFLFRALKSSTNVRQIQ